MTAPRNAPAPGETRGGAGDQVATDQVNGTPESAAVFFRDSYAVLVRGKSVRRHLYLSLHAAERIVKRATARGDHAEMILVRLVPVDARHLDDSGVIGGE